MKDFYLQHPESGKPDPTLTFAVLAFIVVAIKFLLNNVVIGGFNCGSTDSSSIAALMAPIFAHVWDQKNKNNKQNGESDQ